MKILVLLVLLSSSVLLAQALKCWICESQPSNSACILNGRSKKCRPNQQACQNEVRRENGIETVTKRCKQERACGNNYIQNPRPAWEPSQCNLNRKDIPSNCKCCCSTDNCNKDRLECNEKVQQDEPQCSAPPKMEYGIMDCSFHGKKDDEKVMQIGTICTFICNRGYRRKGYYRSICKRNRGYFTRDTAEFNRRTPACIPTFCKPLTPPANGNMSCRNQNYAWSTCSFTCDEGYIIKGHPSTRCFPRTRRWSRDTPSCVLPALCNSHQNPTNGRVTCSNSNIEGSECRFQCSESYVLVGRSVSRCESINGGSRTGRWSSPAPTCRQIKCPSLAAPSNGTISCTDEQNLNSECTFKCNEKYYLKGNSKSVCTSHEQFPTRGVWTYPVPRCIPISCERRAVPKNGDVSCSDGIRLDSECEYSCDVGYTLVGSDTSICTTSQANSNRGVWSSELPSCEPIICSSRDPPDNGVVQCTNGNNFASQCGFTCNPGYSLRGSDSSSCNGNSKNPNRRNGEWSFPPPTCQRIICSPPHSAPTNGEVSCSNQNFISSLCSFDCNFGHVRVGEESSLCLISGRWSTTAPTCKPIICSSRSPPTDGGVKCSDGNNFASQCNYTCNSGYRLRGRDSSICNRNSINPNSDNGEWSSSIPICERIVCPSRNAPSNGKVSCSNQNFAGSSCSYECDFGHISRGSLTSLCQLNGRWSTPTPNCNPIVCPSRDRPISGNVECSNGNNFASQCNFTCDSGTRLRGSYSSICNRNSRNPNSEIGQWSSPPPTCQRIVCPSRNAPSNGKVSCSNQNFAGSSCSYECDFGHILRGSQTSLCQITGRWSTPTPNCNPIVCPSRDRPIDGEVKCTNGNNFASQCNYTCNFGYRLTGSDRLVCNRNSRNPDSVIGDWSASPPFCQQICIPEQVAPSNGKIDCTRQNEDGSSCTVSCDQGYRLSSSKTSTCRNGKWDNPASACLRIECQQVQSLSNGNVTCTNNAFLGSVCSYQCDQSNGYELYPKNLLRTTCLKDSSWDLPPPCCARPCPPFAKMDLVIVLDSSSSIGESNWSIMKAFVRGFINTFYVGEGGSRIAVFRYNKDVDTASQIMLKDFPTDKDGLLTAYDAIPYDGSGTRTGKAIQHVLNVMLRNDSGNRPNIKDIVLVITDGRAQDGLLLTQASQKLRQNGALTYAIGIQPRRGRLDRGQLLDIAGSPENLIIAESGFSGLNTELSQRLSSQICENRCIDEFHRSHDVSALQNNLAILAEG